MRIFVTGATGFVGSATIQELLRAGHQVIGLARSDASVKALAAIGVEAFRGSLEDPDGLKRAAAASEGVVHTAHSHDFNNVSREAAAAQDLVVVEAMGAALEGTGRPFIVTSGMSGMSEADESNAMNPRKGSESLTLALASRGVRSMLIRLPPSVHGDGDHGLVPMLIAIARQKGVSAYLGDGTNRWPAVHQKDAGALYRLVLEKGLAGRRYHAIEDGLVPTREIAEAIGRGLKLPVVSKPAAEAAEHFGFLGSFFGRDVPATATRTREELGWKPSGPGLIEDLERGSYFK